MVCYYCGHKSDVFNSRTQKRTGYLWRRRRCPNCHAVWTTIESPEWSTLLVVEKSRSKNERFSRDKLFLSILESCKHRKDALTAATGLTEVIIGKLAHQSKSGKLPSRVIADVSATALGHFDKTAAAVYKAVHSQ